MDQQQEKIFSLMAVSSIDGRYHETTKEVGQYSSEYGLIKYRVHVEIEWLLTMFGIISPFRFPVEGLTDEETQELKSISENFSVYDALEVKQIEETTKHDVKAVEYYIRGRLKGTTLERFSSYIHFCCTSEDITNLAYGMMITDVVHQLWLPNAEKLIQLVKNVARETATIPMLGHTHGQPASTTTVGKELMVFAYRWEQIFNEIAGLTLTGKFNGAVGNFNAHVVAFPNVDWQFISERFVESLSLEANPITTQIESHDTVCKLFNLIRMFNNITLDFNRDMWQYISMDYFKQTVVAGEVGSSTMPHKVNPINHENSMANAYMSNAVLSMLTDRLPISIMQRDLSDSSAQRNIGLAFAHSLISLKQSFVGFKKMTVSTDTLISDLQDRWEILAEPIQTILRKHGIEDAYEKLKDLTRGKKATREIMKGFIISLEIDPDDKDTLITLTPENYIGIAPDIVQDLMDIVYINL